MDLKSLPPILETDDLSKKKLTKPYKAPTAELIAYLDFSVSTTGVLSGVKVETLSLYKAPVVYPQNIGQRFLFYNYIYGNEFILIFRISEWDLSIFCSDSRSLIAQ